MRALSNQPKRRNRGLVVGFATSALLALSILGAGTASAGNTRNFEVTVSTPTDASQGAFTKFDVRVQSNDNQTIANVKLTIPGAGDTWPANYQNANIFGEDGASCSGFTTTGATCNFGNIIAFDYRLITVLVKVPANATSGTTFSASAETNNENGTNVQVMKGVSGPLAVVPASANGVTTANLSGLVSTADLNTTGAGNLSTTLNLIGNNGGKGNVVVIQEGTETTQPAVCVSLKLTCQPDFVSLTVNDGAPVSPYLETVLTAKVPSSYNIKKAFVIHVLANGQVDSGFPLFNSTTTSCIAHPNLIPCADFSITKAGILTITVHTNGNGNMKY
jgi:hypothetical protein